jgi:large repetitive protein
MCRLLMCRLLFAFVFAVPALAQAQAIAGTSNEIAVSGPCSPLTGTCTIGLVPSPFVPTSLGVGVLPTDLLDLTETWATGGTFWGIKENITNSSSSGSSRLLDLQAGTTGTVSVMSVDQNGIVAASQLVTGSGVSTGPLFTGGAIPCTNGTQNVTFSPGSGGGTGAAGTITVSLGAPTGSVAITSPGYGYTSMPTTATITTCFNAGTFNPSTGTLTGSLWDGVSGTQPSVPATGRLRLFLGSELPGSVDPSGNVGTMILTGRASSGAGQNSTIAAQGAQSAATNTTGGNLYLAPGIGTGNASEHVIVEGYPAGGSGSTDQTAELIWQFGPGGPQPLQPAETLGSPSPGVGVPIYQGSGHLSDATQGGIYVGTAAATFCVIIAVAGTPDQITWGTNLGTCNNLNGGTPVGITGSQQALTGANGVSIGFAATTGHFLGDSWNISAVPAQYPLQSVYLYGASGSPMTQYADLGGTFTTNRNIALPDQSGTLVEAATTFDTGINPSNLGMVPYLGGDYTLTGPAAYYVSPYFGIGPSNTSPAATAHIYNAAPTGSTELLVQGGASQSGSVLVVENNALSQQWTIGQAMNMAGSTLTPATGSANHSSPQLQLIGTAWNGTASVSDTWTMQNVLATGSNPSSTLKFVHLPSADTPEVSVPAALSAKVFVATTATPTVTTCGNGAGTVGTPSCSVSSGTDMSGLIAVTTTTAPAANAPVAIIAFNLSPHPSAPGACIIGPNYAYVTGTATPAQTPYVSSVSTTTFTITSNSTALAATTSYTWWYICM